MAQLSCKQVSKQADITLHAAGRAEEHQPQHGPRAVRVFRGGEYALAVRMLMSHRAAGEKR
jgi:hypothetical protein